MEGLLPEEDCIFYRTHTLTPFSLPPAHLPALPASLHQTWGAPQPDEPHCWHCDPASTSLLQMGISIRGERTLNLKVSAGPHGAEGDVAIATKPQSAGDVYITNPALMLHTPTTQAASYEHRMVAVMARLLLSAEKAAELKSAVAAEPLAALRMSQLLAQCVEDHPFRLPSLAEVLGAEAKLSAADAAERRAAAHIMALPAPSSAVGAAAPPLAALACTCLPSQCMHRPPLGEQVAAIVSDAAAARLLAACLATHPLTHTPGCAAAAVEGGSGAGVEGAAGALCSGCLGILSARLELAQLAQLGLPSSALEAAADADARRALGLLPPPQQLAVVNLCLAALPSALALCDAAGAAALPKVAFATTPLAALAGSRGRAQLLELCLVRGAEAAREFVTGARKGALVTCTPLLSCCGKPIFGVPPPAPELWITGAEAQAAESRSRVTAEGRARAACVSLLLKSGASASVPRTPTMPAPPAVHAGYYGWKEAWVLLRRAGADLEADRNTYGESAWDTLLKKVPEGERAAERARLSLALV